MILQEVYNSFSKMLIINAEYYAGLSLLQNSKLNLEIIINRRKKAMQVILMFYKQSY